MKKSLIIVALICAVFALASCNKGKKPETTGGGTNPTAQPQPTGGGSTQPTGGGSTQPTGGGSTQPTGGTQPSDVEATSVTLSQAEGLTTVYVGENMTLTVVVGPAGASQEVTWESSDSTVATVIDGVVTAVKASETPVTITATAKGNTSVKGTYQVTVSVKTETGSGTVELPPIPLN